jgi:hypothetical protein
MTTDEAIALFSSYSPSEKKEFLAQLMYELTVVARDSYEAGEDGLTNPRRVRRINEVQHCLSAFLGKLLRDDPQRYPDEVLVRIVLEQPEDDVLGQDMMGAFANAHRLTSGVSVS